MPDSLEQLKADAADTLARGMNCDRLVLRAIGLGIDTRLAIKGAIGFDYAAIEKALEREAGAIRVTSKGLIDRLSLADGSSNGSNNRATQSFNPGPPRERDEPTLEKVGVAVDGEVVASSGFEVFVRSEMKCTCGREIGHTGRHWTSVEINVERVRQLRAEGKTQKEICKAIDVNYWTFRDHVARTPELKAALGSKRGVKKESVSPVGYIKEKSEAPTREQIVAEERERAREAQIASLRTAQVDIEEPYTPAEMSGETDRFPPSSAVVARAIDPPIPVNIRIGIQGNKAWLETEDGAVISNIEIEDIQFSTVFPIRIKFKFKGD